MKPGPAPDGRVAAVAGGPSPQDTRPRAGLVRRWLERLADFRNAKVADPAFRLWAARFPLTRRVARREAKALFDLTAGFVYSQVLGASVRCGLFETLSAGPLDHEAIASRIGLAPPAALRLLKAAAALDLVAERSGGRYALGSLGAALVGNAGVTAMITHHDILYRDLADPLALLSGRASPDLSRYWTYAGSAPKPGGQSSGGQPSGGQRSGGQRGAGGPRGHGDYTALMAASQAFVSAEILGAYPIGRHRRLLDVGGGDGSFLVAAGQAAPDLTLALFDLPPVAAIARERILAAGLAARTTVFGGDVFADPLPEGADLVTLNRILHDHDDDRALAILKAVRRAIAPGGTLLVAEPMAGTPGAEASGDAYFGFYLLAMGQGRPRTAEEIGAMLRKAGFGPMTVVPTATPIIARIVAARPSSH